jgi:SAM-dependent methyltransferase
MENNSLNKQYWDNFNKRYSNNWKEAPRVALSGRELGFINKYLNKINANKILDIGVGNGRILQNYIENSGDNTEIYGLDISEKMKAVCEQMFHDEKKIKSIVVCDTSADGICFENTFDFVSAVRVVKYNKNWVKIIENVYKKLNKDGVFVFTMLNKNSISRFADYGVPIYLTNKTEMESILKKNNFEVLEIKSFSKLPAFLYLINNNFYAKILINIEKLLEKILGKIIFGKEFFIAVRKIS